MAEILETIIRARNDSQSAMDAYVKSLDEIKKAQAAAADSAKKLASEQADAEKELKKLAAISGELEKGAQSLGSSLGPVGNILAAWGPAGLAAAAGIGAYLTALTAAVSTIAEWSAQLVDAGSRFDDLSVKTQVSASKLQEWAYAGSLSGVTAEQIATAATNASRRIEDGSKATRAAVQGLGLDINALRSMNPAEQFETLAAAIRGLGDAGEQASAARGLGMTADMLKVLRTDLPATAEEARALGAVLSDETVAGADALGDAGTKVEAAWTGVKAAFVEQLVTNKDLAGALTSMAGLLGDIAGLLRENAPIVRAFWDAFVPVAGIKVGIDAVSGSLYTLTNAFGRAKESAQGFGSMAPGSATFGSAPPKRDDSYLKAIESEAKKLDEAAAKAAARIDKMATELASKLAEMLAKSKAEMVKAAQAGESKLMQAQVAAGLRTQLELQTQLQESEYQTGQVRASSADMARAEARESIRAAQEKLKAAEKLKKLMLEEIKLKLASKTLSVEDRKGLEKQQADLKGATDQTRKFRDGLTLLSQSMQVLGVSADSGFGKMVAGLTAGLAGYEQLKASMKDATNKQKAMAIGQAAINVAMQAYAGGDWKSGAAQGAATGMAVGGAYGAIIGGAIGAGAGYLGGKKKAKEQIEELRKALLDSAGGSFDALKKKAKELGVDIRAAFQPGSTVNQTKQVIEQMNIAIEQQKKRWEGIQTALGGLELRVRGFKASMEGVNDATDASAATFKRLGNYAAATFAGYVKETGDVIAALLAMETSLADLAALQEKFGFEGSKSFERIMSLRGVLQDNKGTAEALQGLNALMKGLSDSRMLTKELFQDFAADAGQIYKDLIAGGATAEQALALMQPTLQRLWEQQKKFGTVTDETTLALIKQAEEQGLVGEGMKDVNEKILDVLLAIGEVLGAKIPAGLKAMGDASDREFERMRRGAERAGAALPNPGGGGGSGGGGGGGGGGGKGGGDGDEGGGFAFGGTVKAPMSGARVTVHGTEHILTPSQLQGYMAAAMQAAGGAGGGTVHVTVVLDGRVVQEFVTKGMEQGRIAPKRGRSRVSA